MTDFGTKEIKYIEQTLELYSKSSEIKAFIKEENKTSFISSIIFIQPLN